MSENLDVISVNEVATLLGKSTSWCYSNAAALGASKIGGSLIFRRSTLIAALNDAKVEQAPGTPKTEESPKMKPRRIAHNGHAAGTDPSAYGLWHFGCLALQSDRVGENPEDIFEGMHLPQVINKLRLH